MRKGNRGAEHREIYREVNPKNGKGSMEMIQHRARSIVAAAKKYSEDMDDLVYAELSK